MITIPAAVTGGAQTGFTTPGYNTTVDTPSDTNAKQSAVTGITGTQSGVDAHSVARPFTISVTRPKVFQSLGKPNPTTGLISKVPFNTYKVIVRKGVTPLAGQPPQVAILRAEISIPAGSDVADANNVRALLSAAIGTLNQVSSGLGDTLVNGVL